MSDAKGIETAIETKSSSRLGGLGCTLALRLALAAITLLQACHAGFAHIRIPSVERLELVRRNNSGELDFRRLGNLGLIDFAVFANRLLCVGVAIGSADKDGGLAVGDTVDQRLLRQEDRASGFL